MTALRSDRAGRRILAAQGVSMLPSPAPIIFDDVVAFHQILPDAKTLRAMTIQNRSQLNNSLSILD
jgi:hypothetical protein